MFTEVTDIARRGLWNFDFRRVLFAIALALYAVVRVTSASCKRFKLPAIDRNYLKLRNGKLILKLVIEASVDSVYLKVNSDGKEQYFVASGRK